MLVDPPNGRQRELCGFSTFRGEAIRQDPVKFWRVSDMHRRIGARTFDFAREVAVMAIINRTPDSFFDNGSTFELDRAVSAAIAAVGDGADFVDVGGVPFGRGPAVSRDEELDRVVPLVKAIRAASDVVISVDTHRAEVARLCIEAGASVINDTSGLYDPKMATVLASSAATLDQW